MRNEFREALTDPQRLADQLARRLGPQLAARARVSDALFRDTQAAEPVEVTRLSAPESEPTFSVVMLTRDHLELTRVAVETLLEATCGERLEFIFVDNGSTDGTLRYFRQVARRTPTAVVQCDPDEHFIYARNCNRGARVAVGHHLLLVNNDIRVETPGLLSLMRRELERPEVGVVGVTTNLTGGNEQQERQAAGRRKAWTSWKPVMGFCWALRREVFEQLGGLDERFDGYGGDEIDFQFRAVKAGFRIRVVAAFVEHLGHQTFPAVFGQGAGRPFHDHNCQKFETKHGVSYVRPWPYACFERYCPDQPPQVSIVIPCYGREDLLRDTVWSCLQQDFPRLEIILVDDGSEPPLTRPFPDPCVRLIRLNDNGGQARARNVGIRQARGQWIKLLDSDDLFLTPDALRRMVAFGEEQVADFVYCRCLYFLANNARVGEVFDPFIDDRILQRNVTSPSEWLVKRDVLATVSFDEGRTRLEDWDWLKRVYAANRFKLAYLSQTLIVQRLTSASHSQYMKDLESRYTAQIEVHRAAAYGRPVPLPQDL